MRNKVKVSTKSPVKKKAVLSESNVQKMVKKRDCVNSSMVIDMKNDCIRKPSSIRLHELIFQSKPERKKNNINAKVALHKRPIKFESEYDHYNTIKKGNFNVRIVLPNEVKKVSSKSDIEMDKRIELSVKAAIERAKVCKKPIARYDPVKKKAYMEYPDGTRKYSE